MTDNSFAMSLAYHTQWIPGALGSALPARPLGSILVSADLFAFLLQLIILHKILHMNPPIAFLVAKVTISNSTTRGPINNEN